MKALRMTLGILGAALAGFGIYFMLKLSWDMNKIMGAANAAKTIDNLSNPMPRIWIAAGLGLGIGLLFGLAIGLPGRTARNVRRDTLREAADQREAAIRENAISRGGSAGEQSLADRAAASPATADGHASPDDVGTDGHAGTAGGPGPEHGE